MTAEGYLVFRAIGSTRLRKGDTPSSEKVLYDASYLNLRDGRILFFFDPLCGGYMLPNDLLHGAQIFLAAMASYFDRIDTSAARSARKIMSMLQNSLALDLYAPLYFSAHRLLALHFILGAKNTAQKKVSAPYFLLSCNAYHRRK